MCISAHHEDARIFGRGHLLPIALGEDAAVRRRRSFNLRIWQLRGSRGDNSPAHPPTLCPSEAAAAPARLGLPTVPQLAWLLVQPRVALDEADARVLARIEQDAEATRVAVLARRFVGLIRRCGVTAERPPSDAVAEFEAWSADVGASGVRALETFAAGLEQDGPAVRAALTTSWSNGQTEGQVTKLKLIKRSMYGRASFDLLRRRVLLAA